VTAPASHEVIYTMSTQKIIPANIFKHGTLISHTDKSGNSNSIDSSLSYDDISMSGVIDGRMKLYRFYSGDENGLTPPTPPETTTTYTIATGADDGKAQTSYRTSTTNTSYTTGFTNSDTTSYLGVNYDDEEIEYKYYAGYFRFTNIAAAQGATIKSAYLSLYKTGYIGYTGNHSFYVAALDADNQAAPTVASHLNHSNYTTAEVVWNDDGAIRTASNDSFVKSPDIKTVIQEIVDRPGWSTGNSIVLTFFQKTAPTYSWAMPRFEFYDDSDTNTPKLEITV